MSVDKALERDRELRANATARPWHEDGSGSMLRVVGPLPRSTIVVDPYGPNPLDARLLLHRVNTYEALEEEIERLRAWLREVRAQLDGISDPTAPRRDDGDLESLARDLRAGVTAALGDERTALQRGKPAGARGENEARIDGART